MSTDEQSATAAPSEPQSIVVERVESLPPPPEMPSMSEVTSPSPVVDSVLEAPATSPVPVPLGTHQRLVGPTTAHKVSKLKTYNSSRNFTAAVAAAHLPVARLQFSVVEKVDTETFTTETVGEGLACTLDMSNLLPKDEELGWRVKDERVDLRWLVYGTIKGVIRTGRVCGQYMRRDERTKISVVEGHDHSRNAIVIAPAYAPAVGLVTDEQVLKGEKLIVSAFPDPGLPCRDLGRLSARCGELFERGVNAYRFVMRLAVLYVYARFSCLTPGRQVIMRMCSEGPKTLDVSNFTNWSRRVTNPSKVYNYVPWVPARRRATPRDARYYQVLAMACAEAITLGTSAEMRLTPLLWPAIPHIVLLGQFVPGTNSYFADVMAADAAFVHEVAVAWCTRYSSISYFKDCVRTVALLYWRDSYSNPLVGAPRAEMSLPAADMSGFLLSPILEDSDKLSPLNLSDYTEHSHRMAYESALTACIIGFCRSYQQYQLLDGALEKGILPGTEAQETAYSLVAKNLPTHGPQIWGCIAAMLKKLGINGQIGLLIGSIGASSSIEEYTQFVKHGAKFRPSSFDMIPFLGRIPVDTAAAGWLAPQPLKKEVVPGQEYLLEHLDEYGGADEVIRTLHEINDVIAIVAIHSRTTSQITTRLAKWMRVDARGFPRDHQLLGWTLPCGGQVNYGLRVDSLEAVHMAMDEQHDRYKLVWYHIPAVANKSLKIKPMDGVFADPAHPTMQFSTAYHEHREMKEHMQKQSEEIVSRLFGCEMPRLHLGTTRHEEDDDDSEGVAGDRGVGAGRFRRGLARGQRGGDRRTSSPDRERSAAGGRRMTQPAGHGGMRFPVDYVEHVMQEEEPPTEKPEDFPVDWLVDELPDKIRGMRQDQIKMLYEMDQATTGEASRDWLLRLGTSVANIDKHTRAYSMGGRSLQPGVLGMDLDVVQKYTTSVPLAVKPQQRSAFLSTAARLLELTLGYYPNPTSTVAVERLIEGLNQAAVHCAENPYLTPRGYLKATGCVEGNHEAAAILARDMKAKEVLELALQTNLPDRAGEYTVPKVRMRRELKVVLNGLDGLDNPYTKKDTPLLSALGQAEMEAYNALDMEEKHIVAQHVATINRRLKAMWEAEEEGTKALSHFIGTRGREDSDDDDAAASGVGQVTRRFHAMSVELAGTAKQRLESKGEQQQRASDEQGKKQNDDSGPPIICVGGHAPNETCLCGVRTESIVDAVVTEATAEVHEIHDVIVPVPDNQQASDAAENRKQSKKPKVSKRKSLPQPSTSAGSIETTLSMESSSSSDEEAFAEVRRTATTAQQRTNVQLLYNVLISVPQKIFQTLDVTLQGIHPGSIRLAKRTIVSCMHRYCVTKAEREIVKEVMKSCNLQTIREAVKIMTYHTRDNVLKAVSLFRKDCTEAKILPTLGDVCGALVNRTVLTTVGISNPGPDRISKKQVRALGHLMRGCACELQRRYGGVWPNLNRNHGRCERVMNYSNAVMWWKSMSQEQKSRYMLEKQYASAGVEHFSFYCEYNLPYESENFSIPEWRKRHTWFYEKFSSGYDCSGEQADALVNEALKTFYERDKLVWTKDFKPFKLQGGVPIVLTSAILAEHFPEYMPMLELLHNMSEESEEYEVATTTFTLFNLPRDLLIEILCQQWFETPLDTWFKVYKEVLVRAKRSNIFGLVRGEQNLMLRKLLNVTIRRKGEADFEVERRSRMYMCYPKEIFFCTADDRIQGLDPKKQYLEEFTSVCRSYWRILQPALSKINSDNTIQKYWQERAVRAPTGASTIVKNYKMDELDARIRQDDRVTKKVTVELLDDDFLKRALELRPLNRASHFVKPEPGKKLRALYASHDEEMFLGAYASDKIENLMYKIKGVMIRQTPADVLAWMAESQNGIGTACCEDAYWMSTDYSDYNSEHTMNEMAIIDATHAEMWEKLCGNVTNTTAFSDKAAAAKWISLSFRDSWIMWGTIKTEAGKSWLTKGDTDLWHVTDGHRFSEGYESREEAAANIGAKIKMWSRTYNGLYSGSRDTARNNTFIHAVDMAIAVNNLRRCGIPFRCLFQALCGDDEDNKFVTPLDAALYYNTLAPCNHQLNPAKQMAGAYNHEFLQLVASRTCRIEKPMCALLATLGTGNWYVQLGQWIQTSVESCIANWWEAYCRGVPLGIARRACAAYLDRLMKIDAKHCEGTEWEKEGKRLEWWSYRAQDNFMPLFANTSGITARIPIFESQPDVQASWPRRATDSYIQRQRRMLDKLPPKCEKEFAEAVQLDTFGTCLKNWRQQTGKRWAAKHWPERFTGPDDTVFKDMRRVHQNVADIAKLHLSTPHRKRVTNENTVFGQMGVNLFIARKLGGMRGLAKHLPLVQWKRAVNVERESYKGGFEYHELQVNIRAALATWKVPHRLYHTSVTKTQKDNVTYIFMANAAGKSHFTRTLGGVDDLDELWCDLYGVFRDNYELACPKSSFSKVAKVARDILVRSAQSTGILLGQLQPEMVQRAMEELRWPIKTFYYDPGEGLRKQRMERRGWDAEKVGRRLQRARDLYEEARKLGWTRLESESEMQQLVMRIAAEAKVPLREQFLVKPKKVMEYVFDQTELVTRQLKIAEENRMRRIGNFAY
ncbi:hypothetical protein [Beihai razor shell virus 4]|uniref:hypothetical protein n=1 Tax=Beihai razor shell virus 4 TaxID=1922648 RepID=UPI00090C5CB8|nr:hypothetical protein [Beihai razor shell virus 4]APG75994.1 hypothetical protein [Beihai razor shell virus 4]